MNHYLPVLLGLAALLPGVLPAQTSGDSVVKPQPVYDIELVIFKNIKAPKSREFILPVSSPSKTEQMLDTTSTRSVLAARELGYEILPDAEFRLLEVVDKIVESPRYELLQHIAWRQPGVERGQALPIWLRGGRIYGSEYTSIDNQIELLESIPRTDGEEPGSGQSYAFDEQTLEALELQLLEQEALRVHQGLYEFEGKITVELARYLHVYTDLVYRRPRLSIDSVTTNAPQDQYLTAYAADTRILNNHSLKEHRRMRSKTLHYLDNPEFGLLILITPFEAAPSADAAPASGG